jgi:hypothetical protein
VVAVVFSQGLSLRELGDTFFVEVSSNERLVHLLVGVEFIDVERSKTDCLAHIVEGWTCLVTEVTTHS